jgi:flagellar basal body-associated protein FliL
MDVSIKVPVVQAAVGIAGFMAVLAEAGAERDQEQQTKTRWALQYHADLLRAGGTAKPCK